jgi:hypothetical protein
MTIGLQAYLQGYMHEKSAAPYDVPEAPLPSPAGLAPLVGSAAASWPNVQKFLPVPKGGPIQDPNILQHMSPWPEETPGYEYEPGIWDGDGTYYSGRTINDPNLEFQRSNQPQGLTKGQQEQRAAALREQKKQWWNPKPAIEGIRDTAKGAASDLYRLGAMMHDDTGAGRSRFQALPNQPSAVGDIKEQAQHLWQDPIRNTKQMAKDMIAGPGGFWNVATPAVGGALFSALRKRKLDNLKRNKLEWLERQRGIDSRKRRLAEFKEENRLRTQAAADAEAARIADLTDPQASVRPKERPLSPVDADGTVRLKPIPKRRADTAAEINSPLRQYPRTASEAAAEVYARTGVRQKSIYETAHPPPPPPKYYGDKGVTSSYPYHQYGKRVE